MDPSSLQVRAPRVEDANEWNAFVEAEPDGTFFHLLGWKDVLESGLGHRTHFRLAERDGRIVGVLPLGEIRSRLFGHSLISTPFCVYGGVLTRDDAVRADLIAEATRIATELRVDHLELRNRVASGSDWPTKDLYVTFRKPIEADHDANMKAIPRKQRAMVRKGIKAGLASEIDGDVDRLYAIYSESVRNLGTPVFPKKMFVTLRSVFGDACEVMTVHKDGEALASVMNFHFRDEVSPYYGGGTFAARPVAANDFMYWEVMRRSAERGARVFDFGRSKRDVGSFRFKKHWGFEPEPLHYEFHLVRALEVPDVNPLNPKYRVFVDTWKKLPVGLTRLVGPFIARNLG